MNIDNGNLDSFNGVTAGIQTEDRWNYKPSGYNATQGIFYIGETESKTLDIVPFAMRQCKEVTDASGVVHRYPIKTKRTDMVEGDIQNRLQVVGIINDELHIFGARSWTARAAWANPMGGPYHDARFEGGIWYRLNNHIKETKNSTGKATAPLCWRLHLEAGEAIDLASAANAKQKATGKPIKAISMAFVGAAKAAEYERLYVDEAIDEWVAEWNRQAIAEAQPEPPAPAPIVLDTVEELIPF
jgi:hypothetical protein